MSTATITSPDNPLAGLTADEQDIAAKIAAQLNTAQEWFQRGNDTGDGDGGGATSTGEGESAEQPAGDAPAGNGVDTAVPDPAVSTTTPQDTPPAPAAPAADLPSADELERLRALASWAGSLDPRVADQFGLIESGRAIAVPTDEFAAYRAWVASQRPAATQSPASAQIDLDELDPQTRAHIEQLQAREAAHAQELEQLRQQQVAARIPEQQAQFEQQTQRIDETMQAYASRTGFTEEQIGALMETAVQAGAFGFFAEQGVTRSPSGMVIATPDIALVTEQALDFARLRRPDIAPDPALVQVPTSQSTTPVPASGTPTAAATPPVPAAPDTVARKRANAASLAAAPSAATQPPMTDPRSFSEQDQRTAIADFLRQQGLAR